MKYLKWVWLFLPVMAMAKPVVKQSFYVLPFGNGTGAGIYQAKSSGGRLVYFYDHIYKKYSDKGPVSKSILKKKGITWGLNDAWLDKAKVRNVEYVNGTGIVKAVKTVSGDKDLVVTEYYFMPMESDKRILVSVLEVENMGDTKKIDPYLYVDAGVSSKESAELKGTVFVESAKNKSKKSPNMNFVVLPGEVERYTYTPSKELPKDASKAPFKPNNKLADEGKNLIGAFQFKGWKLEKGEKKRIAVVCGLAEDTELDAVIEQVKKFADRGADKIVESEIAWWEKWQSISKVPAKLNDGEKRLFRQSLAVLKMGQCREPGKPYGQVLASMPPGEWNITWPRDGAYSIVALARSGHLEEAKAFLQFMLDAPNGKFEGADYVGRPYKISVCRYYGNGDEESDLNQSGPNLEWDDFGLFLWAFSEYMKASNDKEFLNKYYPTVKELVADVLVSLMEPEGYLKRDSSIWERHWEPQNHPDGRKHFAFSTINAYNGLMRFSEYCPAKEKALYQQKAKEIQKGFVKHFVDADGIIAGSLEEKAQGISKCIDAAVVEAINFDVVDKKTAVATLAAFEKYVKAKNSPGFFRNDDATWYDNQEWVVIDLRVSAAYFRNGNPERALELFEWVYDNAEKNFYLIPELLEENTLAFKGAIPMCGFGAGAYVINAYLLKN